MWTARYKRFFDTFLSQNAGYIHLRASQTYEVSDSQSVQSNFTNLAAQKSNKALFDEALTRAVARTLIGGGGGVHIHIFMFCPTSFFSNQIQIDQFEKKSVGQNMNI